MPTTDHKKHKQLSKVFLCFCVALSFFTTLVPMSSASSDTMPCCAGKASGHCDSGITPKRVTPPAEPMCGLDNSELEDDGITIVAEPTHNESETTSNAAESNSVSKPCQMDCGACASVSSRQQKRERAIAEARHQALTSNPIARIEDLPLVFTSNDGRSGIDPRGPPTTIL